MTAPTKLEEALTKYETAAKRYLRHPFVSTDADVAAARAEVLRIVGEVAGAGKSLSDSYAGLYGPSHPKVRRMDAALALVPREEG